MKLLRLSGYPRRRWALAALLLGLALWINLPAPLTSLSRGQSKALTLPVSSPLRGRILILSPHPDDETLCCAGLIAQARRQGAEVYIAWITAGDGFEFDAAVMDHTLRPSQKAMRALGVRRVREARQAAAVLGVPPDHLFMLGFPDGGLYPLFTSHYARPLTARFTGAHAVYVPGAMIPGQAFTGQNLEADLNRVLDRVRPDLVLVPARQDFHPDHHTLTFIALRLLAQRGQSQALRFWMVHGGLEWPIPKGRHPQLALTVPPRASQLPWQRIDLTPEEEALKDRAIGVYRSQTAIMNRFMRAFVRRNELISLATDTGP